ncbi:hypothetical protein INQ51_06920 [Maribellus sp. CM-23]|uniref:hypothetical protein n=1 Tax=Maribellus sp. CM-23 TaxID=2781026 RepID=UPI001F2D4856|nr:hypothetical protein [Maribellus sp. CM-23]MCE4564038.1 hypothetical protein [Maribellus sp. CM-23]
MEADNGNKSEKKKEDPSPKNESWMDKAEAFIDEAADKIHKSDTYRKADETVEEATKKLFRKAGRWWGKL